MPRKKVQKKDRDRYRVFITGKFSKEIICSDCTKQQARDDPWRYAEYEERVREIEYKITKVEIERRND